MNAIGASILIVLILVVLCVPRRWALLGMLAGVLFLTQVQQVQVFGFNLYAMRFLELAGFIRVLSRREFSFSHLNKLDFVLVWLYAFAAVVFSLRSSEGMATEIGTSVDALLCYFTFRGLMVGMDDLRWFLRYFIILLAPYTAMILFESFTHRNAFSLIGGGMYDWTRGDRFRCVGSFRSPDLLGTLGASFLPLYVGLACIKTERKLAYVNLGLCSLIIWASNAGGPIGAAAMGLVGWGLWKKRKEMWKVRRFIAVTIIVLALVMKAPIWYLLAHVSDFTGGDGWHRSYLMDVAFQNIFKWWFAGMPMIETADWFYYQVNNTADITNQYLSFGLNAGLGAIVLFILVLKRAFGRLGDALAVVRLNSPKPSENEFLLWGLGTLLATHVINWFGITYFDQIYVVLFMQLATISSITTHCIEAAPAESQTVDVLQKQADYLEPEMQLKRNLS